MYLDDGDGHGYGYGASVHRTRRARTQTGMIDTAYYGRLAQKGALMSQAACKARAWMVTLDRCYCATSLHMDGIEFVGHDQNSGNTNPRGTFRMCCPVTNNKSSTYFHVVVLSMLTW